ncbi:hypothetical protein Q5762_13895 [Streptomyces sp. P9(2023)]|uniref:DUF6907 domain-containing protein n=1 Tax=Streptomyces sp. P9(2023) TaxID=3064394 RepID=UPI0028F40241|nr:hypothetical protein [Streptomyces sp. P9(2023)]MDT9689409.1 hypothetical protein [Streptomyces sp. P9(2023)]
MTEQRTITLPTLDHGPVALPEPAWCRGHQDHIPGYRVDLAHTGPEHSFAFDGEQLLVAMLSQAPFSETGSRATGLYVEQTGYAATLGYAGTRQLAAALTVHAMHLRTLADSLTAIDAAAEGGPR